MGVVKVAAYIQVEPINMLILLLILILVSLDGPHCMIGLWFCVWGVNGQRGEGRAGWYKF